MTPTREDIAAAGGLLLSIIAAWWLTDFIGAFLT